MSASIEQRIDAELAEWAARKGGAAYLVASCSFQGEPFKTLLPCVIAAAYQVEYSIELRVNVLIEGREIAHTCLPDDIVL